MNACSENINSSSDAMRDGVLKAVSGEEGGQPDPELIELYASTSSSSYLAEAFHKLKSEPRVDKRWTKEACSTAHQASKAACHALIDNLSANISWKYGGPRSICPGDCCVSCEVWGVKLQGNTVNQCLSNREFGCA